MEHTGQAVAGALAIIGMGCRFPGSHGVEEFWDTLVNNVDSVTPVPADRFDATAYYHPAVGTPGKTVSQHGGFLDDVFGFDAAFFGVSPVEAESMDPQQRVLLQVVWEAVEAAGIRPTDLAGTRTGVFVGQATSDYADTDIPRTGRGVREMAGSRVRAVTAGRISYALDLRGPSLVLDTACSSSLVAVHTARQSLLTGESDLAIASGVNVILSPHDAIAYSQGGMLSRGGRCRFGDAQADGFVRSEGVGAVILKRLPDALRDGNPVLALLLGSAVTNDGRASGLLLQPSVAGQVEMLREACRSAGITPAQLDYVEAHGTGTRVGDSVELRALAEASADGRDPGRPLTTGSVKSNIGHAESAAGIAGLIKAVLVAQRGVVPASLHLNDPNPLLTREQPAVRVVSSNEALDRGGSRALVGVSSFGISGTNAHAVVGEYVPMPRQRKEPSGPDRADGPHLLVLSARSVTSLRGLAAAYADHLGPQGAGRRFPLRDICATAATRRDAHPHRLWITGSSHDDLAKGLRALANGETIHHGGTAEAGFTDARRTVFVFPGQGSQWLGMGRGLLASSPAFRTTLEACDRVISRECGWSVLELLTSGATEFPADISTVQPALWAMEVALAAAWREKGVEPDACVGHSMGEVAAAHLAGALSLDDAAAVICRRSRLMERVTGRGAMLLAELSAEEARHAIAPYGSSVCIAAENSPTNTVLAGDPDALAAIEREVQARGLLCRLVNVSVASHSPDMDPLRDDLLDALATLAPTGTDTQMFSSVHCAPVAGPELTASYWMVNLRQPVRFTEAVRRVASQAESVFVEVSPHPLLVGAITETLEAHDLPGSALCTVRRGQDEREALTQAVGRLFAAGGRVDWRLWFGDETRTVPLPSYRWDTRHFRYRPSGEPAGVHVREVGLDRLGIGAWGDGLKLRGQLSVVPPVFYLATALEAASDALPGEMFSLEEARFGTELLDTTAASDTGLRTTIGAPGERGHRRVHVEALRAGSATTLATAVLRAADPAGDKLASQVLHSALGRCHQYLSAVEFQVLARRRGVEIGEPFQAVEHLWRRDGEAVARLRRPKAPSPAAWEAGLHTLLAAIPALASADAYGVPHVVESFARVELFGELPEEFWSVSRCTAESGGQVTRGDVLVLTPEGRILASFQGIRLRPLALPGSAAPALTTASRLARHLTHTLATLTRDGTPRVKAYVDRLLTPRPSRPTAKITTLKAVGDEASTADLTGRATDPVTSDTGVTVRQARRAAGPSATPRPTPVSPRDAAPDALLSHAADVLGMAVTDIDPRRPLRDLGLDSLMAVQLKRLLRAECGVEVSTDQLLGGEPVGGIAQRLLAS